MTDGVQRGAAVSQTNNDLVPMDVEMPVLVSIAATQARKAQQGNSATPIVDLFAHAIEGDRKRFVEAGITN